MAKQKPTPGGSRKVEASDIPTHETKLEQVRWRARVITANLSATEDEYLEWAKAAREAKLSAEDISAQLAQWKVEHGRKNFNDEVIALVLGGALPADPEGDREHAAIQQQRRDGMHRPYGVS